MTDTNSLVVEIAGLVFEIVCDIPLGLTKLEHTYRDFGSSSEPDVRIQLHYAGIPHLQLDDAEMLFDSGATWSLYRQGARRVFVLRSEPAGAEAYCVAVFDAQFKHGNVFTRILPNGTIPNPLEYPLSEVLMVCLLAQGRGLMVHACGVNDRGHGSLFAGNSTHRKSTMARLWREHATILNDDRIVLRRDGAKIWMYGTPWHGNYSEVSPQGIALDALFFLRHAEANEAVPLKPAQALSMLLTRSFPPLWDAAGMEFTLDFCAQVVASVPCSELGFVPTPEIVDYVRCVKLA
jgi:hypothetical protein